MLGALGAGTIPLALVVWAFFATWLPFATPGTPHPWRAIVPFAGLAVLAMALGYLDRTEGPGLGFLAAMPGAFVGGVLGLLAALRPSDLHLTILLVAAFILAGSLGGWLGSRVKARLHGSG